MKWKDYNTCGHKLLNYFLGYLAHHAEMERRIKKGQKQRKCKECGLYLFEDEQPTSPEFVNKKPEMSIEEDKKKDERNAIGFAHWKDRHFERTYPKTGYFYCLANYESVKLIPGVKYGEHYSFEQLYELYIVSQK